MDVDKEADYLRWFNRCQAAGIIRDDLHHRETTLRTVYNAAYDDGFDAGFEDGSDTVAYNTGFSEGVKINSVKLKRSKALLEELTSHLDDLI